MKYWTVIPTIVKNSKRLTAEEKDLYYLIFDNLNEANYCILTNSELANKLNVSEKTITSRLSNMKAKGFINIILNFHKHRRQIYINLPQNRDKSIPDKPSEKDLDDKTKKLINALKKSIIFGTIDFNVLIEKLLESPYLHEVKDNSKQFAVSEEQIKFLVEMKKLNKSFDCQIALFPNINYHALTKEIYFSEFLMKSKNLNLKFMLENADKIISGYYRNTVSSFVNKNLKERDYEPNELNFYFQRIEDIEI